MFQRLPLLGAFRASLARNRPPDDPLPPKPEDLTSLKEAKKIPSTGAIKQSLKQQNPGATPESPDVLLTHTASPTPKKQTLSYPLRTGSQAHVYQHIIQNIMHFHKARGHEKRKPCVLAKSPSVKMSIARAQVGIPGWATQLCDRLVWLWILSVSITLSTK